MLHCISKNLGRNKKQSLITRKWDTIMIYNDQRRKADWFITMSIKSNELKHGVITRKLCNCAICNYNIKFYPLEVSWHHHMQVPQPDRYRHSCLFYPLIQHSLDFRNDLSPTKMKQNRSEEIRYVLKCAVI